MGRKKPLGLVAFIALTLQPVAGDSLPIISDFTGGTIQSVYYGGSTGDVVGFSFDADVDLRVTALGIANDPDDRILHMVHSVGLWDATTQTLLASATIDSTDLVTDGFFYKELGSTVQLAAGTSYVLGALFADSNEVLIDHFTSNPSAVSSSNISNTAAVFPSAKDLGFVFPGETSSGNLARLGPNMLAEPISAPTLYVPSDHGLCGSGQDINELQTDIVGDTNQELIITSSRNTLNLADVSGRATMTAERRIEAVAEDGGTIFKTLWFVVESPAMFQSDWALHPDFSPIGPAGRFVCDGGTIATYDIGGGPQSWLVYVGGFSAWDNIDYSDASHLRVWVFDAQGSLQNKFNVEGVVGWKLDTSLLRVADYDGDGNDDLIVARTRPATPGSTKYDHRTKVFGLLDGTLLKTINTSFVKSNRNLN